MNKYGRDLYQNLYKDAKQSSRKRTHFNLHKSYDEKVQRLIIALVRGSFVEPHFHSLSHQWESFFVLEGKIEVNIYTDEGEIASSCIIGDNEEFQFIELQPKEIHSVQCISEVATILEIKEGPFIPENAKTIAEFLKP
ncbi:WbuC family cupin fold metalloprotein [Vibrio fluvialis]|uniref:WbuC family cupin fold metalloprotein n=1 Tax=Vibrio fluvialis TaxID=676 RepID=UPI000C22869A|nr:WbuC family cupin fold metalloprotein [Vibrio fluvialis]MBL4240366.1 WbuC family cupin fold metalloprotein [Vibrio fluvialis]MBL4266455.1 WbuC family cupin fold metalloprotein [Vibrio fluvialis]MBL4271079.1 WbuC family cupin fold metalloprotein [Vibrio fluvialis]MBL4275323.1 WbuC family cupin fold metalloprotein [Vibrio fluvialis]MBO1442507.1 WbuC family cupin fold metalloprotein [Vibrio fluvialis]